MPDDLEPEVPSDGLFEGEHRRSLDDKARLVLPAEFRRLLGEGVVMTLGQDRTISVHPKRDWAKVSSALQAARRSDPRARRITRMLYASASRQDLDRQGRISVPPNLREYAGLRKDVVVTGVGDRIEIWDAATYDAYFTEGVEDVANLSESLGLGIF